MDVFRHSEVWSYYADTNEEGKPNEVGAHHARLRKRVPDARNALGTRKGIGIVDTSSINRGEVSSS